MGNTANAKSSNLKQKLYRRGFLQATFEGGCQGLVARQVCGAADLGRGCEHLAVGSLHAVAHSNDLTLGYGSSEQKAHQQSRIAVLHTLQELLRILHCTSKHGGHGLSPSSPLP